MRQEITVHRTLPVNLVPKDKLIFDSALSVSFQRLFPVYLKNVWILQDTIFSPGEIKFYAKFTHIAELGLLQFAKRTALCCTKSWRKITRGIWVTDEWSANYFHWMTDCLPRILEGIQRDPSAPIILPEAYRSLGYVVQSLELLSVRVEFFKSRENLCVDTLILTARTATYPNFNPPLVQKTRELLAPKIKESASKKVYISRKLASKRKAQNEFEVELLLRKRGFDIVCAEQLNVRQQIDLMAETKLLVSLHGAALTNMLFLPNDAKVLELRKVGDSKTQCYFNLSSALQLNYYYTLNQGNHPETILADFMIDLQALESTLDLIEKK